MALLLGGVWVGAPRGGRQSPPPHLGSQEPAAVSCFHVLSFYALMCETRHTDVGAVAPARAEACVSQRRESQGDLRCLTFPGPWRAEPIGDTVTGQCCRSPWTRLCACCPAPGRCLWRRVETRACGLLLSLSLPAGAGAASLQAIAGPLSSRCCSEGAQPGTDRIRGPDRGVAARCSCSGTWGEL